MPQIDQKQDVYKRQVVQSLDNVSIHQSKNIFISLAARSIPKTSNHLPYLSEPVEGAISIKAPKGLKLFRRGGERDGTEFPANYKNGQYTITLDKTLGTYWLVLSEQ